MKSKYFSFLLTLFVASGLLFGLSSCNKDDDDDPLPPIDGYDNAGEVANDNLVAYWPLDGNDTEDISNSAASKSENATYTDGVKGKAVKFNEGFLAYNPITSLNSLPNMTVSLWANFDNNGSHPTVFFTMSRENEWAGNINLQAETGWYPAGNDTLLLKGLVVTNVDGNPSFQDSRNEPSEGGDQVPTGVNKWNHIVMTWDGATSNFRIYHNGIKVNNPEWEQRGDTGPLNFFTPTRPIIGAWETNVSGDTSEEWQVPMTGLIDEVRVYDKALTEAEIGALYKLEKAGR